MKNKYSKEKKLLKQMKYSLLLLLGAAIWGAAFVAQRAGMGALGPFTFSGIRMLLGGFVMIPVSLWSRKQTGSAYGTSAEARRTQRIAGLLCGLFLFAATSLQQVALVNTSAGKAGFITALYVVLVPVAGFLLFGARPGRMVWLGVALSVVALYLLCVPASGFQVEPSDWMLIGCALCFTGQILSIDRFASRVDAATLARDEFLVTGALSMLIALATEEITWQGIRAAMIPILYTGILSSAVGYTLQIVGQKHVNPTLASLIMCLESVFAVLTGALILHETLTLRESIGSVLMFLAVVLAQLSPMLEKRKGSEQV